MTIQGYMLAIKMPDGAETTDNERPELLIWRITEVYIGE